GNRYLNAVLAVLMYIIIQSHTRVCVGDSVYESRDRETHMKILKFVLERLAAAGLVLSPEKCSFLKDYITYLGLRLSREGIRPDPSNVDTVLGWKYPTTPRLVKSILSAASFYRRFVPGFSSRTKALRE